MHEKVLCCRTQAGLLGHRCMTHDHTQVYIWESWLWNP